MDNNPITTSRDSKTAGKPPKRTAEKVPKAGKRQRIAKPRENPLDEERPRPSLSNPVAEDDVNVPQVQPGIDRPGEDQIEAKNDGSKVKRRTKNEEARIREQFMRKDFKPNSSAGGHESRGAVEKTASIGDQDTELDSESPAPILLSLAKAPKVGPRYVFHMIPPHLAPNKWRDLASAFTLANDDDDEMYDSTEPRGKQLCVGCMIYKPRLFFYLGVNVKICNACNQHWRRHYHECDVCKRLMKLGAYAEKRGVDYEKKKQLVIEGKVKPKPEPQAKSNPSKVASTNSSTQRPCRYETRSEIEERIKTFTFDDELYVEKTMSASQLPNTMTDGNTRYECASYEADSEGQSYEGSSLVRPQLDMHSADSLADSNGYEPFPLSEYVDEHDADNPHPPSKFQQRQPKRLPDSLPISHTSHRDHSANQHPYIRDEIMSVQGTTQSVISGLNHIHHFNADDDTVTESSGHDEQE